METSAKDMEKENRIYASLSTLLMFGILLFIVFFIKFITPLPPFPPNDESSEIGLATNFGLTNEGMGDNFTYDQVQDKTKQDKTKVQDDASASDQNVITDDSKDNTDVIKKTDKKDHPKKDKDQKKDQVKEQHPDKDVENALKNFSDNPNGDGDKNKTGNQGDPNGGDAKNYDGNNKTGNGGDDKFGKGPGGPIVYLKGRRIHYPPDKITDFTEEGVIVVDIIVDKNGKVISAEANRAKSINPNYVLCAKAQLAAKATKFNESPDGTLEQKGTITFKFTLK